MKLIIQIPAYNEEETLPLTLSLLPKRIKGIKKIEWLIIDDGSTDNTVKIAKKHGAHHVVSSIKNQGLAKTFTLGIETALKLGADIIVNTDADNQYNADDIKLLVQPILDGAADIVIGARPISDTKHFSFLKRFLQKLGSLVVRVVSDTTIPDAPSGFRAISRHAAMGLNIFNEYTYTLEMIIQAGKKGIAITSVPIRTNKDERPSKLVRSIPNYIKRSVITMLRIFNTYRPLYFFIAIGLIPLLLGLGLGVRWMTFYMGTGHAEHLPSLILAAVFIILGTQLCIFGLLADLMSVNRKLLEDIQRHSRETRFNSVSNPK
jgi:glycosyltransferase involved in cell wall biosynthesis